MTVTGAWLKIKNKKLLRNKNIKRNHEYIIYADIMNIVKYIMNYNKIFRFQAKGELANSTMICTHVSTKVI